MNRSRIRRLRIRRDRSCYRGIGPELPRGRFLVSLHILRSLGRDGASPDRREHPDRSPGGRWSLPMAQWPSPPPPPEP